VAERHETQKKKVVLTKIRGGDVAIVALGCFSNLSGITTIDTTMKRE
jgi:hypothetical protein